MTRPPLEFDHIHIIAENPHNTAAWYVEMLGAEITADTVARGAPQIFIFVISAVAIFRFPVSMLSGASRLHFLVRR